MSDRVQEGLLERHTPGGGDRGGGELGAERSETPELGGADPEALIEGLPDLEAGDVLALAAELVAAPRRTRGRPPGAVNRKNGEMVAYLAALGHRDPWVTLSLIQTADTAKLAELLGGPLIVEGKAVRDADGKVMHVPANRLKVLALQKAAAEAIMPYHHGKRPQQLELGGLGDKRPLMVIGEMNVSVVGGLDGVMSAGLAPEAGPLISLENSVRPEGERSHDGGKAS